MQYADLAGKVFATAAVYLQRTTGNFDVSGKAVVVIGRSQRTGAVLIKVPLSTTPFSTPAAVTLCPLVSMTAVLLASARQD